MHHKVQRESVLSGVAYSFTGNVLYAGSQWLISSFIVKTGGASLLGIYAICMAVIAPAIALASMNLRSVLVTDAARAFAFPDYLGLRSLSAAVCAILVAAILWTVPRMTPAAWCFGVSICLYRVAETIPDIIQGVFQRAGKMRLVAASLFFRAVAVVLVFAIFSLGLKHVTISFLVLAFVSLVITFLFDVRLAGSFERVSAQLTTKTVSLARLSLPLTIGALLGNIHVTLPRYYLNRLGQLDVIGQFAALTNVMVIGLIIAQAMGTTLSPRMADHFHRNEKAAFLRMSLGLLMADGLICCGILLMTHFFGRWLLELLYNSEIAAAADALPVFVLSLGLSLFDSHFGVILTAMQVFRSQIPLQLAKVAICFILSYTLFRDNVSLINGIKLLNWSLVVGICIEIWLVGRALSPRSKNPGSVLAVKPETERVSTQIPCQPSGSQAGSQ